MVSGTDLLNQLQIHLSILSWQCWASTSSFVSIFLVSLHPPRPMRVTRQAYLLYASCSCQCGLEPGPSRCFQSPAFTDALKNHPNSNHSGSQLLPAEFSGGALLLSLSRFCSFFPELPLHPRSSKLSTVLPGFYFCLFNSLTSYLVSSITFAEIL